MVRRGWARDLAALLAIAVCYGLLQLVGITCPIRFFTGLSCPGCGMTRAWLAVLRLDLAAAFAWHPLFWTVPLAGVLFLLRDRLPQRVVRGAAWGLCALFLGVYAFRLLSGCAPQAVDWAPTEGLAYRLWSGLLRRG